MINTLDNGILHIEIDSLGAEVKSIYSKKHKKEMLWQGDPKYWEGRSPVLFPIVGGLIDGEYEFENKTYRMGNHGFARSSQFIIEKANDATLSYILTDDAKTISQYPFHFSLRIEHRLIENELRISFNVTNTGKAPMYFSIGAHPAFDCSINKEDRIDGYYLEFETKECLERRYIADGVLSGERGIFLKDENILYLSHELFYRKALIFDNVKSEWIKIRNKFDSSVIKVVIRDHPYLGIWSAVNDAPFVCIEPWHGITSTSGADKDISKKEGIIKLLEKDVFSSNYCMIIE